MNKKGYSLLEILVASLISTIIFAGIAMYLPVATSIANGINLEAKAMSINNLLITRITNDIRQGSWLNSSGDNNLQIYTAEFDENYPSIVYDVITDNDKTLLQRTEQDPLTGNEISSSKIYEDMYKSLPIIKFNKINELHAKINMQVKLNINNKDLISRKRELSLYCRGNRLGGMPPTN